MKIVNYTETSSNLWNNFLNTAKNSLFLFNREYMEYHSDRFPDHSLLIYEDDIPVALLPGTIQDSNYSSHAGLTFGGFITDSRMTTKKMLDIFDMTKTYLSEIGINIWLYKCIPHIYSEIPSEEDRYAIFMNNGTLFRRDVTTSINLKNVVPFQKNRRRGVRKAEKEGLIIKESNDFIEYWDILTECLSKNHQTLPVHALKEIMYLKERFPNNIRLFGSYMNNSIIAGVIIYEHQYVAHAQYIAASEIGRDNGGLDILFSHLINERYCNKNYFDFGISNEDNGRYLNEGLIFQKEGFGARAIVHDCYEVPING